MRRLVWLLLPAAVWLGWHLSRQAADSPPSAHPPEAEAPTRVESRPAAWGHRQTAGLVASRHVSPSPDTAGPPPAESGRIPVPDLSQIPQRQAHYRALLALPPIRLWQHWRELAGTRDPNRHLAWLLAGNALPYVLRRDFPPPLYQTLARQLARADAHEALGEQLPLLLGRAATPDSLSLLLSQALVENDREKRLLLLQGVERAARTRWADRFHPELSPPLENAWLQVKTEDDPALLNTLALSLARVGDPAGIALLAQSIQQGGETLEALSQNREAHVLAAAGALPAIRNPEAVPLLADYLRQNKIDAPLYHAGGEALSRLGGRTAAQVLLDWARTAPPRAAPLAERWFGQLPDTAAREFVRQNLDAASFEHSDLRRAIEDALDASWAN